MKTEQELIDSIKTFEDAQKVTGRPNVPNFSHLPEDLQKYFVAQYKMVVIAEALNAEWNPNWDDSDEWKYFPYFIMSPSGFAFHYSTSWYSASTAGAGSRLCFKTRALARYAGEQFVELWKDLMLK